MAKAALNMMTRTSAPDLAANQRIFMTAVDTGWINDENPREKATRNAERSHYLLLTTYYLLFTTYYLLLTTYCLLLTAYHLLITNY